MNKQAENMPRRRKKIGLALGGGGAKGLAHIGVIKALEEARIPIDFIAGTSMGALIGGWYALNKDIKFLENIIIKASENENASPEKILATKGKAFFKDLSIADILKLSFNHHEFKNCLIPFKAVATNVEDGSEEILESGLLSCAIEASIAIPVVFSPVKVGGKLLMDGGFCNPVPADVVRAMGADFVIAVDISSRWVNVPENLSNSKDVYSVILNSFCAVEYQISKHILEKADLIVKPAVMTYNLLNFQKAGEIIEAGKIETERNLPRIREEAGYEKLPPKTLGEAFLRLLESEN
jgi:NTE family protein